MPDDTTTIPQRMTSLKTASLETTPAGVTSMVRLVPLAVVLLAGVLIAGACYWKLQQPAGSMAGQEVRSEGLAPRFELFDQRGQMFRLERHLGRESVSLVFCGDLSSSPGDGGRRWLESLVKDLQVVEAEGVVPVVISCGIPQESRRWANEFQLTKITWLSDLDGAVHRLYGCWDERTERSKLGIVQIDRRGKLPLSGRVPVSQETWQRTSQR